MTGRPILSSAGAGRNCARPMRLPDPSPVLDKNRASMGPEFYPVLGLGSGERLLWHFQTAILYWINFSLRMTTKFLEDEICSFKIVLSWRFPRKPYF